MFLNAAPLSARIPHASSVSDNAVVREPPDVIVNAIINNQTNLLYIYIYIYASIHPPIKGMEWNGIIKGFHHERRKTRQAVSGTPKDVKLFRSSTDSEKSRKENKKLQAEDALSFPSFQ
mmetsp:Transcript_7659/g.21876  ORF Transcript_7659/g.21876 Transcript_7659/m.21876 type:complete len:119 (-) Transcript_7659:198-554(-)